MSEELVRLSKHLAKKGGDATIIQEIPDPQSLLREVEIDRMRLQVALYLQTSERMLKVTRKQYDLLGSVLQELDLRKGDLSEMSMKDLLGIASMASSWLKPLNQQMVLMGSRRQAGDLTPAEQVRDLVAWLAKVKEARDAWSEELPEDHSPRSPVTTAIVPEEDPPPSP